MTITPVKETSKDSETKSEKGSKSDSKGNVEKGIRREKGLSGLLKNLFAKKSESPQRIEREVTSAGSKVSLRESPQSVDDNSVVELKPSGQNRKSLQLSRLSIGSRTERSGPSTGSSTRSVAKTTIPQLDLYTSEQKIALWGGCHQKLIIIHEVLRKDNRKDKDQTLVFEDNTLKWAKLIECNEESRKKGFVEVVSTIHNAFSMGHIHFVLPDNTNMLIRSLMKTLSDNPHIQSYLRGSAPAIVGLKNLWIWTLLRQLYVQDKMLAEIKDMEKLLEDTNDSRKIILNALETRQFQIVEKIKNEYLKPKDNKEYIEKPSDILALNEAQVDQFVGLLGIEDLLVLLPEYRDKKMVVSYRHLEQIILYQPAEVLGFNSGALTPALQGFKRFFTNCASSWESYKEFLRSLGMTEDPPNNVPALQYFLQKLQKDPGNYSMITKENCIEALSEFQKGNYIDSAKRILDPWNPYLEKTRKDFRLMLIQLLFKAGDFLTNNNVPLEPNWKQTYSMRDHDDSGEEFAKLLKTMADKIKIFLNSAKEKTQDLPKQ